MSVNPCIVALIGLVFILAGLGLIIPFEIFKSKPC